MKMQPIIGRIALSLRSFEHTKGSSHVRTHSLVTPYNYTGVSLHPINYPRSVYFSTVVPVVTDKLSEPLSVKSNTNNNNETVSLPTFLKKPYTVSCIGAPLSWGQTYQGTDQAPSLLRQSGLFTTIDDLENKPWTIEDEGDLPFHTLINTKTTTVVSGTQNSTLHIPSPSNHHHQLHNVNLVGTANELLYRKVFQKTKEGKFVLTLGGDHSIALGSIAGLLHAYASSLRIIWVDAHADINLPETSPSGNIHGMPLAFLFKFIDTSESPYFDHYRWLQHIPALQPSQLVYIGLRDLDKGEKKIIKEKKLRAYTMHDIDRYGIGKVMEMTLDYLYPSVKNTTIPNSSNDTSVSSSFSTFPLHISFDIDAIDPLITPATGTRVPGGLSLREAHYICEASAETGSLVSMDCVEVNPLLSPNPTSTVDTAIQLIGSALGKRIL